MAEHFPSLKRERSSHDGVETEGDFFPIGLHVGDDVLEAMKLGDVELGEERLIMGVVRVTSVSAHESATGKDRSVSLDLIEGTTAPKPNQKSESDKATILFGGG